jgi:uncharacterized membrane protein
MLPPWPGWTGLHPLVIHFPIALLLVAPVFVLGAIVRPRNAARFTLPALVLLVLGTAGAFVAVATGEAAAELVTRSDAVAAALERHSELAETARNIFALLTFVYAAIVIRPVGLRALARPAYTVAANAMFLVLLLGGNLLIANAAHQGGMLVHGLNVQAFQPADPAVAQDRDER